MPPAHSPSTCVASVPVIASTASSASKTAWAYVSSPQSRWRSSGLRQDIANVICSL